MRCAEGRAAARRRRERDRAGGGGQFRARHQAVDESELERFVSAQRFAGQHQVERGRHADELRRAHRAAEPGMDAELDLRQAEVQLAVVGADAVVAGERELEPAAEREAVNRGDRRHRQRFEAIEDLLARAHEAISLLDDP